MPNDFVDTFNSVIPSHIMKFIVWHDVDDSDEEVSDEEVQYEEEEVEEDVVEPEHFYINKNHRFNK